MSNAVVPARRWVPQIGPVNRRLIVLLAALFIVFGLLLGERLVTGASLRSMAFQLPELGILSLAMMVHCCRAVSTCRLSPPQTSSRSPLPS